MRGTHPLAAKPDSKLQKLLVDFETASFYVALAVLQLAM